jgi:hypothetical protein
VTIPKRYSPEIAFAPCVGTENREPFWFLSGWCDLPAGHRLSPADCRVAGQVVPNPNRDFPRWENGAREDRGLRPKAFAISLAGGRELVEGHLLTKVAAPDRVRERLSARVQIKEYVAQIMASSLDGPHGSNAPRRGLTISAN